MGKRLKLIRGCLGIVTDMRWQSSSRFDLADIFILQNSSYDYCGPGLGSVIPVRQGPKLLVAMRSIHLNLAAGTYAALPLCNEKWLLTPYQVYCCHILLLI